MARVKDRYSRVVPQKHQPAKSCISSLGELYFALGNAVATKEWSNPVAVPPLRTRFPAHRK